MERSDSDEEGIRAASDGPEKVGTGETLHGITAPISDTCAPVSELAYERGLQPRDQSGLPGSIPGWGTKFSPARNLCDIKLRCGKKPKRNAQMVNEGRKRNALSSKATRKRRSQNC